VDFNAIVSSDMPISKVSFVRAGSVTHSFDQGQRYMELPFEQSGDSLDITAPANANLAPPGLYMLFVFNDNGVPSEARLVMLGNGLTTPPTADPDPADTNPQNLLANGGFENDKANWTACSASDLSQVSTDSHRGGKALLQQSGACLYQEIPVTPGTTYTVSCDGFAQDSSYSSMSINMLDAGYRELTEETLQVSADNYQRYEQSLTAPAAAAVSAITLYADGPTYFDSCIVTTDNSTEPAPPVEPTPPPADNLLTNAAFDQSKTGWSDCAASELTTITTDSDTNANLLKVENAGCIYQEFNATAGKQYHVQCTAKSDNSQYTSITLQVSDASYNLLDDNVTVVPPGAFDTYNASLTAPASSAIGAVTLYSEDASYFDACFVVER
ncbi:MAG: galactose oxidase-like domain-containing protein, partial [Pseudomonadota bacterium]